MGSLSDRSSDFRSSVPKVSSHGLTLRSRKLPGGPIETIVRGLIRKF